MSNKQKVTKPHPISFRVSDDVYFRIQAEIHNTNGQKNKLVSDYCRDMVESGKTTIIDTSAQIYALFLLKKISNDNNQTLKHLRHLNKNNIISEDKYNSVLDAMVINSRNTDDLVSVFKL